MAAHSDLLLEFQQWRQHEAACRLARVTARQPTDRPASLTLPALDAGIRHDESLSSLPDQTEPTVRGDTLQPAEATDSRDPPGSPTTEDQLSAACAELHSMCVQSRLGRVWQRRPSARLALLQLAEQHRPLRPLQVKELTPLQQSSPLIQSPPVSGAPQPRAHTATPAVGPSSTPGRQTPWKSWTPMEGVPERFTATKRKPSFLAQRRRSMHQAVTPAEGVPETCFFGVTPAVQHIPIVRLPSMTPMQGLMSPAEEAGMSPATMHAAYLQAKAARCAAPLVQPCPPAPAITAALPAAAPAAVQPQVSSTPEVPLSLNLGDDDSDEDAPMGFGSPGEPSPMHGSLSPSRHELGVQTGPSLGIPSPGPSMAGADIAIDEGGAPYDSPQDGAGCVPGLPGVHVHQFPASSQEAEQLPPAQPTPQPAPRRVTRRSSHHQKLRRSVHSRKSLAGDGLQEGGDGVRRSMRVSRAPLAWYLNDFKHFSRKNHRSLPTVEAYVTHQPTTPWKFEDGKARKAARKAS